MYRRLEDLLKELIKWTGCTLSIDLNDTPSPCSSESEPSRPQSPLKKLEACKEGVDTVGTVLIFSMIPILAVYVLLDLYSRWQKGNATVRSEIVCGWISASTGIWWGFRGGQK